MSSTTDSPNIPIDKQIDDRVNAFIEKWLPDYYPHLVDSDDNDGEYLRRDLRNLVATAKQEAYKAALYDVGYPIIGGRLKSVENHLERLDAHLNNPEEEKS